MLVLERLAIFIQSVPIAEPISKNVKIPPQKELGAPVRDLIRYEQLGGKRHLQGSSCLRMLFCVSHV
jgi:hypothetical protein